MGFDVTDLQGIHACFFKCFADNGFLGGTIRGGKSTAGTILVDGCPLDHGMDLVPVRQGVLKPFEHHDAAPFSPDKAICGSIERFAFAVRGHHLVPTERDRVDGRQDQVHARRQGHAAFTRLQAQTGLVDRYKGRRAGRVNAQRWSYKSEEIGEASRSNAPGSARGEIGIDARRPSGRHHQLRVVIRADADKGAGCGFVQFGHRGMPRIL